MTAGCVRCGRGTGDLPASRGWIPSRKGKVLYPQPAVDPVRPLSALNSAARTSVAVGAKVTVPAETGRGLAGRPALFGGDSNGERENNMLARIGAAAESTRHPRHPRLPRHPRHPVLRSARKDAMDRATTHPNEDK